MRIAPPSRPFWKQLTRRIQWEDMAPIAEMVGYEPHPAQLMIHRDRSRFRVPVMGRRFGKSKLSSFEAVATSTLGGWVMCAAPTYDLASTVFEEALTMLTSGKLRSMVVGYRTQKGDQVISLASGGRIVGRSTDNQKSLVSKGWDLIVFDEAAKEPDGQAWSRQLRPSLADREGGAIFPTTPEGDNWLKDIWSKGDTGVRGYRSWQLPSSANPLLTPSELAELSEDLTELDYQQEILAIFLDDVGGVFKGYQAVATAQWQDEPLPGHRYVLGVDIAQYDDWTVIAVYDLKLNAIVHLVRFNQIDWPMQERRIAEASRTWRAPVLIDATNNEAVAQHVAEMVAWNGVYAFKFTHLSKTEVINQLSLWIQHQEIALLDRETDLGRTALYEIGSYRYERTPSGILKMNAPPGKHDDIVIAIALAAEMASRSVGDRPHIGGTAHDAPPKLAGTYGRTDDEVEKKRPSLVGSKTQRPRLR